MKTVWRLSLAVLLSVLACCSSNEGAGTVEEPDKVAELPPAVELPKVDVDLYVYALCKWCVKLQKTMKGVLAEMGPSVHFKQHYQVNLAENCLSDPKCMPQVLEGDRIGLCVQQHYPDDFRYLDVAQCMDYNWDKTIPEKYWEECAAGLGFDTAKIAVCAAGEEGKKLLGEAGKHRDKQVSAGITVSPVLVIGGKMLFGAKWEKNEIERQICCAFAKEKAPAVCAGIREKCPQDTTINVTVLSDERCPACEEAAVKVADKLKETYPNVASKIVDYSDPAQKALFDRLGGMSLPLAVVDKAAAGLEGYEKIKDNILEVDDLLVFKWMQVGWDPSKEICGNGADDNGDGKVDCDDDDCGEKPACRKEIPGTLDLFVMSKCPFASAAEKGMVDVLGTFKGQLKFNLHLIVSVFSEDEAGKLLEKDRVGCTEPMSDGKIYCGHQPGEFSESLRAVCVRKITAKTPVKLLDYMACVSEAPGADWEKCAGQGKLDAKKIKACAEGEEGLKLLGEDARLARAMGIHASPTYIGNNNAILEMKDHKAASIKAAICQINGKLKACKTAAPAAP